MDMLASQAITCRVRQKRIYQRGFLLVLLTGSLIVIPLLIAFRRQSYPDLDILLIFSILVGFMWLALLADYGPLASAIEIQEDGFGVKKIGQPLRWHSYSSIQSYTERPNSSQPESFEELTVYLTDDWFVVRSNEFEEYQYLKNLFAQYGQAGPRRKVLTLTERNRFRWGIIGLAVLISANIGFAYIAHNSTDKRPAQLIPITDRVDRILENKDKSRLKGFTLRLHNWPDFQFYAGRNKYDTDIRSLKQAVIINQPITVLIRESEYRKKLIKAEPLTFGDKYDNYSVITVFGVDQFPGVHLRTSQRVQEPTHTNPLVRTLLFSLALLICWAGWVYIDQRTILRAD